MNLFGKKTKPDPAPFPLSEFDVENLPVFAIERANGVTCFGILKCDGYDDHCYYLACTPAEHDAYVLRLRRKLKMLETR